MSRPTLLFFVIISLLLTACGGQETVAQVTPSPVNTEQPTATSTSTPAPTATATSSPTPTSTATPTHTPTPTNTVTPTATPTPTDTPTPEPTDTPTPIPPTAVPTQAPTSTPVPQSSSPCPISTDSSYGYSAGNPIRVGGDVFGGPARARAYLDTLRGPQGQATSYSRDGSIFSETLNTILDIYTLTYDGPGSPATLYIDQYSYTTPMAPVGLTCASAFPLSAP